MRKLLLLDADVIIDLHILNLFEKLAKAYELMVVRQVFKEAKYYKRGNKEIQIDIGKMVTKVQKIEVDCLEKVILEAKEARLTIDPGEAESIAYLIKDKKNTLFCTCDKAAIKLISYMELEDKSASFEAALRGAGIHRTLYPRHLETIFKNCIKDGKALRIQFKALI